jgi:hypothetical protein
MKTLGQKHSFSGRSLPPVFFRGDLRVGEHDIAGGFQLNLLKPKKRSFGSIGRAYLLVNIKSWGTYTNYFWIHTQRL